MASDAGRDDTKPGAGDTVLAEAIQQEHELTFLEAVKLYPTAVGWSAFVSIGVIMLAFDPQLLGNLYATPQFQRDFGYEFEGEVSVCPQSCAYRETLTLIALGSISSVRAAESGLCFPSY